jgi:hypothetical protein
MPTAGGEVLAWRWLEPTTEQRQSRRPWPLLLPAGVGDEDSELDGWCGRRTRPVCLNRAS